MSKKEEIQEFVGKFIDGLTKLMRAAASEAVDAAFGDDDGETAAAKPARTVKSLRRASAPKQLPEAANGTGTLQKQILAVIRSNPGCGGGLIKVETGAQQWQLRTILVDLVAAGAVKKTGNGRGTTYSLR